MVRGLEGRSPTPPEAERFFVLVRSTESKICSFLLFGILRTVP